MRVLNERLTARSLAVPSDDQVGRLTESSSDSGLPPFFDDQEAVEMEQQGLCSGCGYRRMFLWEGDNVVLPDGTVVSVILTTAGQLAELREGGRLGRARTFVRTSEEALAVAAVLARREQGKL